MVTNEPAPENHYLQYSDRRMRAGGDEIYQRKHQTKNVISVYSGLCGLVAASVSGERVQRSGDFMQFFSKKQ
ncbi:hypothetical protein GKC49_20480 [Pantoea agglomerans]|uniref:Uncharacterized protein n=2 Tax=Enterobacter agglomerans TaxID=549 RepID=A0A7X2SX86_ENTAG|nr:hypothetical protein [Pantoea agglomerans]